MDKLDLNSFTKEQIEKAMKCQTADELIALAKAEGIEITKEQAEAYLEELENVELDQEALDEVAGGSITSRCHQDNQNRKSIYD